MKFKAGDKVRVKSKEWYDRERWGDRVIFSEYDFTSGMVVWLTKEVTITSVYIDSYNIEEDDGRWFWIDDMFEGLVDETATNTVTPTTTPTVTEFKDPANYKMDSKPPNKPQTYTSETIERIKERVDKSPKKIFKDNLTDVFIELRDFLVDKHSKYGSFYENPPNILTELSVRDRILSRIEEKLSRLMAGSKDEDTLKDIVGLWFHLQIEENKKLIEQETPAK